MTLRFVPLAPDHVSAAVALGRAAYAAERRHVPALTEPDITASLAGAMSDLIQRGCGIAALRDGDLAGFLAFHGPFDHFFGDGTGVFSPLHGGAVTGGDRERLWSLLFQHAAEALTARGANTFAMTIYRHDADAAAALSLNGFGIRCADAIRLVDPPLDVAPLLGGITYEEIGWADAAELLPLKNGLVRHLRRSPAFVAAGEFTPGQFAALNERRQGRFFIARNRRRPVGYLELTNDGENFLTTAPGMANICGAYLDEAYRGHDLYRNLLAFTLAALRDGGIKRAGVDFETMNPTALHFWTKDFAVYTHSYARRIDKLG